MSSSPAPPSAYRSLQLYVTSCREQPLYRQCSFKTDYLLTLVIVIIISHAFDLVTIARQPLLANRRLFAFTKARAPDDINVWSPGAGLGKILIPEEW